MIGKFIRREGILLALGIAVLLCALFAADGSAARVAEIRIHPYGGSGEDPEAIALHEENGAYFLFLPADAEENRLTAWSGGSITVDGRKAGDGETVPELYREGVHELRAGKETVQVTVMRSASLPAVFLTTQSGSLAALHAAKQNKEEGWIRIREGGQLLEDRRLKQIKGRGNATWRYDKKPYNLRFDEKTDLLGMGGAKKWCLLANAADASLLRNALAWRLAEAAGLPWTPAWRHVDLYINGDYLGNYLLCENVEVGENRVDIRDLEKENKRLNIAAEGLPQAGSGPGGAVPSGGEKGSAKWTELPETPEDLSGGYLLELDYERNYDRETAGFVTENGQCVVIRSPEHASRAETEYIAALVNEAEEALRSPDGVNAQGRHYSEYCDLDALASVYLIREWGSDLDAGLSSTFLVKPENAEKLIASPVWDMDRAFGDHLRRFNLDYGDPEIWWANSLSYFEQTNNIPTLFNAAWRHADFRETVRAKWEQWSRDGVLDMLNAFLEEEGGKLRASAAMDAARWGREENHGEACGQIRDFLAKRKAALDKGFSPDAVMLYYDANGGNGSIFNAAILTRGESAEVLERIQQQTRAAPPRDGLYFAGWNTAPDGSGETFLPGDSLRPEEDTTLYALWTETAEKAYAWPQVSSLTMISEREACPSDEAFGNFRAVRTGKMAGGVLYRAASPLFYNAKGTTVDALMAKAGVNTVLNMAYTPETVAGTMEQDFFRDSHILKVYSAGNVYAEEMTWFPNEGFTEGLVRGLTFLAAHDPPYLIHCHHGKDRTGVAAMVLEMLAGGSREEIVADYMLTYTNLYGIQERTEAWDLISQKEVIRFLNLLAAQYGSPEDLPGTAKAYLLANGMEEEALDRLIQRLLGD